MYNKNNIFAKIISGEIPATKLYEDEMLIAIKDINPAAPIHIFYLLYLKETTLDFADFVKKAPSDHINHYFKTIAKDNGANEYRTVSNNGLSSGQYVFHFHTHILSGSKNINLIDKNL